MLPIYQTLSESWLDLETKFSAISYLVFYICSNTSVEMMGSKYLRNMNLGTSFVFDKINMLKLNKHLSNLIDIKNYWNIN